MHVDLLKIKRRPKIWEDDFEQDEKMETQKYVFNF